MTYVGSAVVTLAVVVSMGVASVMDERVGTWRGGDGERDDLRRVWCSRGGMSSIVRRSVLPNPP